MDFIRKILISKKNRNTTQAVETVSSPLVLMHLKEARLSFTNEDYPTALFHCQEVLNLDPRNADAYRIRGVIKYHLQDAPGAAEDLQHSLKFS